MPLNWKPRSPAPLPRAHRQTGPKADKWRVEYANGVTEVCEFRDDGTAAVGEPVRIARRKATVRGGAVVVAAGP